MGKSLNLIVVDGTYEVLDMNVEILKELGHNIICQCSNGKQAVEAFRIFHNIIDAVVIDYEMLELNGLEAFNLMRKIEPDFKNIIFFTSINDGILINTITTFGAFYLEKPAMIENMNPFFEIIEKRKRPSLTLDILGAEFIDLKNETESLIDTNQIYPIHDQVDHHHLQWLIPLLQLRCEQINNTMESHRLYNTGLRKLITKEASNERSNW